MPDDKDNVYRFAPLSAYPFKQRVLIRWADWVFYIAISVIGATIRFETEGAENLRKIENDRKLPVYATWHDQIFLGTFYLKRRGIVFLTSQSFDGEYIARFLQRLGFGVIRGSSTRGGAKGLVKMIRGMNAGLAMGFTVDGPKGPRHEVKSGVVLLAKKTGNPILPFMLRPRKYWTLNSWDGLQIPQPFTRAMMRFGEPIEVPQDAGDEEIENIRAELQSELDRLAGSGEDLTM
ncbi:MAG: lysophospholipid acyltransferase family protein [Acidobacteriota bacterium]